MAAASISPPLQEFVLTLDPVEKILFTGAKLGEEPTSCTLKITNPTKERYAFKVKCTSNEMFRIRPPVGALKPAETVSVMLTFNPGKPMPDNGKHYFSIYYIKSIDEKLAPRIAWTESKGDPEGMKRLFVDFVKENGEKGEDGGEKKENNKAETIDDRANAEKKEDEKKEEEKK